jgi:LAS superfamily LD-carboxypeptidase LdcB
MKKFLLYICFVVACFTASAQAPEVIEDESNDKIAQKIEALYVAFITKEINLTPEEAQKFWPVHTQYAAELKAIHKETTTDELSKQQAVLNVKKKYQANFVKLLGNDRCNNFYRKDGEFRKRMMDRIRQMRQKRLERDRNGGGRRGKGERPN